MRFAQAANFSSTNVCATRLAVSASGKVLIASKIWPAIDQAKAVIPGGVENGAAGKPRHGREGRRLSEREVSEIKSRCKTEERFHGIFRLRFASLRMTS